MPCLLIVTDGLNYGGAPLIIHNIRMRTSIQKAVELQITFCFTRYVTVFTAWVVDELVV